ncbi:MAG: AI-2E family transporter [Sphingomonadales bacterium]|nr:AI-2E family transporter [Sphingomonadales bacterium]MDE2172066.1 AI-2E family transporter [Sphingomonadales bacterium]
MTIGKEVAGFHDGMPDHARSRDRRTGLGAPVELRALLGLAIGAMVVAALYVGKDVFIPITLAVVLSFILSPLVNRLQHWRLWRGAAVFLAVLGALGAIGLVGTLIGSQAAALSEQAPQYAQTIQAKVHNLEGFASLKLGRLTRRLGIVLPSVEAPQAAPAPSSTQDAASTGTSEPPVSPVTSNSPLTIARTLLGPLLGPLETTIIVLVVAIFVLMQKEDLRDRFVRLLGAHDLHRTTLALDDAGQRLSRYFLAQLGVNSAFGVVIGLGLWAIGVPSAAMWGVLAGMLRFVPYIGSFLAAIAPMALAAAIEPGWTSALEVALLFALFEPITGYVLEPLLYGHSTGLSPISVIVAALFWTWLWGPIGLILSTPLTLCLVVTGRHVKAMEFFDILLGDRPALTPVEVFYQRLLANHVDAMLAFARQVLHEASLIEFHDEVLIPSLRLATQDHARGVMTADRVEAIHTSLHVLVEELGDDMDVPPVEPGRENVLCIPGPGPFDRIVAHVLLQLLLQDGTPATVARGPDEDASMSEAVLCCADPATSAALRRSVMRRWRRAHPAMALAVGFWPVEAPASQGVPLDAEGPVFRSLAAAVGHCLDGQEPEISEDAAQPAQCLPDSARA